jgi:hypothetical protein
METVTHMTGIRILGRRALELDNRRSLFMSYGNRTHGTRKASASAATHWTGGEFQTPVVKEENKEASKLEEIVDQAQDVLVQTRSVFPFTLFPTHITIDRHKLTIVYREFFQFEQTVSVPIEDIKNVQADAGPFFGTLTITSDLFINNTQKIPWLKRRDVRYIQQLVQGAMVALKEKIDISKVPSPKLCDLLIELGSGHSPTVLGTV